MSDYQKIITVNKPVDEVYAAITEHIPDWWSNDFTGTAARTDDSFNIAFGETRKTFEVIEAISDEKVIWKCVKAYIDMPSLKNKAEWEGTKIIWTLSTNNQETTLNFLHEGLNQDFECYDVCEAGWNQFLASLQLYLTTGTGDPFLKADKKGQKEATTSVSMMSKIATLCLLFLINFNVFNARAQEIKMKIPATSSGQRIEQDFGLGMISITYYRPNTKGRKIFGEMESYGVVWRTGANNATIITLTDTIQIEGNTVAPGSYSLFSIPGANEWTIILNKNTEQWGAYAYDSKQDLFRFNVKPIKLTAKVETLTIQFADVHEEDCVLQILWENTGINLNLKTNIGNRIMANIAEAMKGEKKPYYMSAVWYYNHNKNLDQALAWMQEQDKAQPQAYNVKYWLARLQLKKGDKKAAIDYANEGLKLASAQNNAEYIRMNKEVLRDAGVK